MDDNSTPTMNNNSTDSLSSSDTLASATVQSDHPVSSQKKRKAVADTAATDPSANKRRSFALPAASVFDKDQRAVPPAQTPTENSHPGTSRLTGTSATPATPAPAAPAVPATDKAGRTKTSAWRLQWWRQWRRGQQERQQQERQQQLDRDLERQLAQNLAEAEKEARRREACHEVGDRRFVSIREAGYSLTFATKCASKAAMYAAYNAKYRGSKEDIAYAETTAAIALATGMATYAAAPKDCSTWDLTWVIREAPAYDVSWAAGASACADCALLSAEAASAAAKANRTRSRTFAQWWRPRAQKPLPKSPKHVDIGVVVDKIVCAAIWCAAAVQAAVEAAQTSTVTTTSWRGKQVPYDMEDATRLLRVSKMAHASAASANAAAGAVSTIHPVLSLRAARAASIAMAAATKATVMRMKVLADFAEASGGHSRKKPINDWLATLASLSSETAPLDFAACQADLWARDLRVLLAAEENYTTPHTVAYSMEQGGWTVATTGHSPSSVAASASPSAKDHKE